MGRGRRMISISRSSSSGCGVTSKGLRYNHNGKKKKKTLFRRKKESCFFRRIYSSASGTRSIALMSFAFQLMRLDVIHSLGFL